LALARQPRARSSSPAPGKPGAGLPARDPSQTPPAGRGGSFGGRRSSRDARPRKTRLLSNLWENSAARGNGSGAVNSVGFDAFELSEQAAGQTAAAAPKKRRARSTSPSDAPDLNAPPSQPGRQADCPVASPANLPIARAVFPCASTNGRARQRYPRRHEDGAASKATCGPRPLRLSP